MGGHNLPFEWHENAADAAWEYTPEKDHHLISRLINQFR